jgi:hypothetical protein
MAVIGGDVVTISEDVVTILFLVELFEQGVIVKLECFLKGGHKCRWNLIGLETIRDKAEQGRGGGGDAALRNLDSKRE